MSLEALILFFQYVYQCVFTSELAINCSFSESKYSLVTFLINSLFFYGSLILEAFFLLVCGLLSLSFEICGVCSLRDWSSLLMYLTLLTIDIVRNVICN